MPLRLILLSTSQTQNSSSSSSSAAASPPPQRSSVKTAAMDVFAEGIEGLLMKVGVFALVQVLVAGMRGRVRGLRRLLPLDLETMHLRRILRQRDLAAGGSGGVRARAPYLPPDSRRLRGGPR